MPPPRRALLGRLALLLGSLLACLLAVEAWFRDQEGTITFPAGEPGRGFATRPNTRGTNRHGFLERDLPPGPAAEPGVYRVAVLGDSMTWGTTAAEETWPRFAEQSLGPPWQFLNFAHYGYDARACAATLRHHAAAWEPDLVVYASYTNDLFPNTIIEVGAARYPVWIGGPFPRPALWHRSALLRALDGMGRSRGLVPAPDPDLYGAQVREMARMAADAGADFLVLGLLPHVFAGQGCEGPPGFCDQHREWFAAQEQIVQALGVEWVSTAPLLAGAEREDFYPANPEDHEHPGVEGHRWLGQGFARALSQRQSPGTRPGSIIEPEMEP